MNKVIVVLKYGTQIEVEIDWYLDEDTLVKDLKEAFNAKSIIIEGFHY